MQELQLGSVLQGGRYTIKRVLGQGGFGITYLAVQSGLDREVAVKEFFMKEYCDRNATTSQITLGSEGSRQLVARFREKFLKEARNIARLNHPHIVRVIDVFEENGTAYYVMEYASGGSLASKVKREGFLPEAEATRYIRQVADALDYIHQRKMSHLDVKPANIMLDEEDNTLLIDFGLAKQYDAASGEATSSTPVGISVGYAPMEQYEQGGVGTFSPETDVYSLAATFYTLLTGETPPSAFKVNEDGVPVDKLRAKGVSQTAIDAISQAMQSRKTRTNNVRSFVDGLTASEQPNPVGEETVDAQKVTEEREHKEAEDKAAAEKAKQKARRKAAEKRRKQKKRALSISIFGLVVVVLAALGLWGWSVENTKTKARAAQSTAASFSNGVLTVKGVTYEMVLVEAGTFMMGATPEMEDTHNLWDNAKPVHQVTLTKDYYIGKTEVTQALWQAVMGSNPSHFKGNNKPVESVDWNDCQKFIAKLNALTGKKFRLPTEAEWEFAARGGNKSKHYRYSGSNNLDEVAWYDEDWNKGTTHDVATKKPNELGIYDMSGNVDECCSDWYGDYSSSAQTDPIGPKDGSSRVLRGGSWVIVADFCRSSGRGGYGSFGRSFTDGLRLVLSE